MSFSQKQITVQFDLANGQFNGGGNTASISGLRVSAHIVTPGGATQSQMNLAIYGLPLSLMNQLSTVGTQYNKQYQNGVVVHAGDADSGMSVVFNGDIYTAFVDAQSMPQVCFRVQAMPGRFHAVKPATPISISGTADAAGMMSNLASQMGFGFENAGVTAKLSNPYYGGTAWTQALAIARHAGFDMIIDRGTMAIIPPAKTRQGGAVLISPQTGMVGYPTFNQNNVVVKALFNPSVKYGGAIQVQSDLTPACGMWKVGRLEYDLECLVPHNKWFMVMEGIQIGATTP